MKRLVILFLAAIVLLASCGTTRNVTRTSSDTVTDLSGRWNDTDSRLVAEEMVEDCLTKPWLDRFFAEEDRVPVVIVGAIRNRSSEHIDTRMFTKDIERELINSGQVEFVASADEREGIREEKIDQQSEASLDTMKRLGQETGADLMLIGVITSVTDQIEGEKAVLYQVDMELINIESNRKLWIGSKKIKKYIEQDRFKL